MSMNFYLFYGLNRGFINKRVNDIIDKYNIDSNNIIKYNFKDNCIDDVLEEASMNSMFALNKLILIESNLKEEIDTDKLESYMKNFNPNTYIIITCNIEKVDSRRKLYKLFVKYGKVEELVLNQSNAHDFIKSCVNNNNYKIDNSDISYLVAKVGFNIDNIKSELEKLFIYKIDTKVITREDIDDITIPNIEDEIFAITDAVIKNDVKLSLNLYNEFMNRNYEVTQIIGLLANQFRFLYQVKHLYNNSKYQDEIAKILDVHPYRVKLAINNIYNYSESDLLGYLNKLAILDKNIKTGLVNKNTALELFLVNKDL